MSSTINALPLPNIYKGIGMLAMYYIHKQTQIAKYIPTPKHLRVQGGYSASKYK